jgi:hypothetical protein
MLACGCQKDDRHKLTNDPPEGGISMQRYSAFGMLFDVEAILISSLKF